MLVESTFRNINVIKVVPIWISKICRGRVYASPSWWSTGLAPDLPVLTAWSVWPLPAANGGHLPDFFDCSVCLCCVTCSVCRSAVIWPLPVSLRSTSRARACCGSRWSRAGASRSRRCAAPWRPPATARTCAVWRRAGRPPSSAPRRRRGRPRPRRTDHRHCQHSEPIYDQRQLDCVRRESQRRVTRVVSPVAPSDVRTEGWVVLATLRCQEHRVGSSEGRGTGRRWRTQHRAESPSGVCRCW